MKFKSDSADPVRCAGATTSCRKFYGRNSVRRHKEFKLRFACQDSRNTNTQTKVVSKLEIVPLPEAYLTCVPFCMIAWFCPFLLMSKQLVSKVDIRIRWRISYKNKRGADFGADNFSAKPRIHLQFFKLEE